MLSRIVTVSALAVTSVMDIWSSTRRESASVGGRQKICFDFLPLFTSSNDSLLSESSITASGQTVEEKFPTFNVSVVNWVSFCLFLSDCLAVSHGHFLTLFLEPFGRPLIFLILATAEVADGDNVVDNDPKERRSKETFCVSGGRPRRRLCFKCSILSIVRTRFGWHLIFIGVTVRLLDDWVSDSRSDADCSLVLVSVSLSSAAETLPSDFLGEEAEVSLSSSSSPSSSSSSEPASLLSFTCCWTWQTITTDNDVIHTLRQLTANSCNSLLLTWVMGVFFWYQLTWVIVDTELLNSLLSSIHTHTHLTALCPGLPRWAGTRKVKTNLDITEARDSEWQWHQLGHMQVYTSLQADNHTRTPPLSFLQAGCSSCHPTNSVKALKAFKALKALYNA